MQLLPVLSLLTLLYEAAVLAIDHHTTAANLGAMCISHMKHSGVSFQMKNTVQT